MEITNNIPIYDSSTASSAALDNNLGQQAFFEILAAEMSNQNPLDPTDSTETIAQLAQFSSLEQMQNVNNGIAEMRSLLEDYFSGRESFAFEQQILDSAVLIGKHVTSDKVSGTVEEIRQKNGFLYAVVEGTELDFMEIESIQESMVAEQGFFEEDFLTVSDAVETSAENQADSDAAVETETVEAEPDGGEAVG